MRSKRTIENLSEHEQMLRSVVTNAPVMLWALDRDRKITYLEGQVLPTLGLSTEKALGNSFDEVFSALPDLINATQQVFEGDPTSVSIEVGDKVLEARQAPICDPQGEIAGLTGIAFDISDYKQTELALVAQKQLFENLVAIARVTTERPTLEATLQNVLDVTAELTGAALGSLFLLNEDSEATRSILALGKAEPERKTEIVDGMLKSGLAGWVVRNRKAALIHDTQEDDRWLVRADDEYKLRSALSVPILFKSLVIGVLTLTHPDPNRFSEDQLNLIKAAADQMALALRNAQIFEEQRRMADLQQTLYQVLRRIGGHLDPESVSHAAVEEIVRLTDWQSVAIAFPSEAGDHLFVQAEAGDITVGEGWTLPIDEGVVGRAYRTGELQSVPDVNRDQDYYAVEPEIRSEMAVPLRRGEHILGILNVESTEMLAFSSTDIQLAESLADAISLAFENARLFQESQRTADRLRELDRLKSSFLANMSHELRTPLNAILGYSELLQEDARDLGSEDFVSDLEKIQRAGRHLLAVINDILDFSKIEAGRMELFLEAFDITALVDDVVTTIQPVIEKNENSLDVKCPKDLGAMTADPTKVRSILINLLSNATKFSEKGEIVLSANRKQMKGMEWISFVVSDHGIGMSQKVLDNLFQPFIQGDISTTRKYGGTGLGLAITRGFCHMMAGDISVESTLGEGSIFTVNIPVDVSTMTSDYATH